MIEKKEDVGTAGLVGRERTTFDKMWSKEQQVREQLGYSEVKLLAGAESLQRIANLPSTHLPTRFKNSLSLVKMNPV